MIFIDVFSFSFFSDHFFSPAKFNYYNELFCLFFSEKPTQQIGSKAGEPRKESKE